MLVPVHWVLGVVMLMGFVFPTPPAGGVQPYFTVVVVAVDVDADSNEPFCDSPGAAKSTVPDVTFQVMARAVAPAVPVWTTEVTAVAPSGIATAAAISNIFFSILLLRSPRTNAGLAQGGGCPPRLPPTRPHRRQTRSFGRVGIRSVRDRTAKGSRRHGDHHVHRLRPRPPSLEAGGRALRDRARSGPNWKKGEAGRRPCLPLLEELLLRNGV